MMLQLMLLAMTFSQQKVQTLTRCHIMRSLIWVHTVCIMSHVWDTLPFQQIVQAPIRRHMYKNGFRQKHKISSVFCAVLVVFIFQNYNLSKRFESLITRRDKIRFSLEKLIIRHVFMCFSKLIIIYIYIYFPQFILLKK